ncbi:nickel-type superoxide dismutase maturation protease [Actinomadura nitritigenes]|uniref:nickel-type superoxide dismutase maturation protease n=1 Tax=Actinomadura nitritigenes TaxID=134602 RepID=UPI003D8CE0B3
MRMRHPVAWTLGGALLLALAGTRGRLRTVAVDGDSMLPALAPGDWLVVLAGVRPRPGDVVIARHPERADVLIVKRVAHRSGTGWWLESDNQRARGRRDSWDFGAVPDGHVLGRVVARYWPWRRASVRPGAGRAVDGR